MKKKMKPKAGSKGTVKFIRKNGRIIPITVKSSKNSTAIKKGKSIKIEKNSDIDKADKNYKSKRGKATAAGGAVAGGAALRHVSHGTKGTLKKSKAGKRLKYLGKMAKTSRGKSGLIFAGAAAVGGAALGRMFGSQYAKASEGAKLEKKYGKKPTIAIIKKASKANKTGF